MAKCRSQRQSTSSRVQFFARPWPVWQVRSFSKRDSKSEIFDKFTQLHAQCFGDPQQGVQADPLFPSLNLSNVNRVEISLFSQSFLAQSGFNALRADCITKNLQLWAWTRHKLLKEQEQNNANTPNMALFLSCIIPAKVVQFRKRPSANEQEMPKQL